MDRKERFESAISRSPVDRVPLFFYHLSAGNHLQHACGRTIREGYYNPEVFAEICLAAREFGFDNLMAGWGDVLVEAQAFGTAISFSRDDYYPRVISYGVRDATDIDKVEVIDPINDPGWSIPIRAARIMIERAGDHWPIVGGINAPFVVASEVWGYEALLIALLREPDLAHELIEKIAESEIIFTDHLAAAGIEYCSIEDATAAADQIDPHLCQEFDLAYCQRIVRRLRSNEIETIVQNCARFPYISDQMRMLQPDALHIDVREVGAEEIPDRARICLVAGLDHERLLYRGSAEEIQSEVTRVLDVFGPLGTMIAPAGELPFDTPLPQIKHLVTAVASNQR